MIRVTIELVPASGERPRLLGTAIIANDGTGTEYIGNYRAVFQTHGRPWRKGRVTGFPRQDLSAWDLLYRALRDAVGGRNP